MATSTFHFVYGELQNVLSADDFVSYVFYDRDTDDFVINILCFVDKVQRDINNPEASLLECTVCGVFSHPIQTLGSLYLQKRIP